MDVLCIVLGNFWFMQCLAWRTLVAYARFGMVSMKSRI